MLIVHLASPRDENGRTGVCCACSLAACMKLPVSCMISTCEIECCKSTFRQPNKASILETKCRSGLWASRSPFCLPRMSCLPQSGSVDVCCTWTIPKVNSFPSCSSVQCCRLLGNRPSVATAPLQKPRSPCSRWKRFLSCFSLAGKLTGRLASGIVAKQLGNCNGTWSNPSIFL